MSSHKDSSVRFASSAAQFEIRRCPAGHKHHVPVGWQSDGEREKWRTARIVRRKMRTPYRNTTHRWFVLSRCGEKLAECLTLREAEGLRSVMTLEAG